MSAPSGQIPVVLGSRPPRIRSANLSSPISSAAGPRTSTPLPIQSGIPAVLTQPGQGVPMTAPIQSLFGVPAMCNNVPRFPGQSGIIATAPVLSWGSGAMVPQTNHQLPVPQVLISGVPVPTGGVAMQPGLLGPCPGAVAGQPLGPFPLNPANTFGLNQPAWPPRVMPATGTPAGFPPSQSSSNLGTRAPVNNQSTESTIAPVPSVTRTNDHEKRGHSRSKNHNRQSQHGHRSHRHHGKRKEHTHHSDEVAGSDNERPRKRHRSGSRHHHHGHHHHRSERGTILLEDGELETDSDTNMDMRLYEQHVSDAHVTKRGTVYRDDRDSPVSEIGDNTTAGNLTYESRRGTVLRDDRDTQVSNIDFYPPNVEGIETSRRGTILRDDRDFYEKDKGSAKRATGSLKSKRVTVYRDDRESPVSDTGDYKTGANQTYESRRGTVLRDDRDFQASDCVSAKRKASGIKESRRGTILRDDRDFQELGSAKQKAGSVTESRRGTILVEDREEEFPQRRGATLMDDRNDYNSSGYQQKVNDVKTSRRGTILREDRDSPVSDIGGYQQYVSDTNKSQRGTILRDDREFDQGSFKRKATSTKESNRGTILLEDRSKELSHGTILMDDRGEFAMRRSDSGKILRYVDRERNRADTVLIDDRGELDVDDKRSLRGTILRDDRIERSANDNRHRTGTVLMDDRGDQKRSLRGTILRDDRDNQEYESDSSRGSHTKQTEYRKKIYHGQRKTILRDDRDEQITILRDDRDVRTQRTIVKDDRDVQSQRRDSRDMQSHQTILRDDRSGQPHATLLKDDMNEPSETILRDDRGGQPQTAILRDGLGESSQSQKGKRSMQTHEQSMGEVRCIQIKVELLEEAEDGNGVKQRKRAQSVNKSQREEECKSGAVYPDKHSGAESKGDVNTSREGSSQVTSKRGASGSRNIVSQETAKGDANGSRNIVRQRTANGDKKDASETTNADGQETSKGAERGGPRNIDSLETSKGTRVAGGAIKDDFQETSKGNVSGPRNVDSRKTAKGCASGSMNTNSREIDKRAKRDVIRARNSDSQNTSKRDLSGTRKGNSRETFKGAARKGNNQVTESKGAMGDMDRANKTDGISPGDSWDARDYFVSQSKDDRPANRKQFSEASNRPRDSRGSCREESDYQARRPARDTSRDHRRPSSAYGDRVRASREGYRSSRARSNSLERGYGSGSGNSVGSRDSPGLDFNNSDEERAWEDLTDKEKAKIRDRWNVDSKEKPEIFHKVLDEAERLSKKLEPIVEPNSMWIRCSLADPYFKRELKTGIMRATDKMKALEDKFYDKISLRAERARWKLPPCEEPPKRRVHLHFGDSDDSSSSSDSDSGQVEEWMEEMRRKQRHPHRLHYELWGNDKGELNVGPLCRCSLKSQAVGVRHSKFKGEKPIPKCDQSSNNLNKLHHYRISVSPVTNFLMKNPTTIYFDKHEYMFEGFSLFTHNKIAKLPPCQVVRFNIMYTIHVIDEQAPENFSVRSLDLVTKFLYDDILELLDIDWYGARGPDSCRRFHLMPRFARICPENGKELLSMNDVLTYLLKSGKPVVSQSDVPRLLKMSSAEWLSFVDKFRGSVVTCPGRKPSSVRIDQLDKNPSRDSKYPLIIHHGWRPAQLSYVGDPAYKKKWREYNKLRHLTSGLPNDEKNKAKLEDLEYELMQLRLQSCTKREVTVELDSRDFVHTGLWTDIFQHAMLLPVLFEHLRFHASLAVLQKRLGWFFRDKSLLQLALTHGSYKVNYGTNPDHSRNSLTNCGNRQVEFGEFKPASRTRKRGLHILLRVMSQMGQKHEIRSEIPHNERLEFLGDAVVEFITSIHLYFMMPYMNEGELTIYRGALVQNEHLCVLAKRLGFDQFMLYAHGSDLCHEFDLKHAMANCFEAILGALYLDGGMRAADRLMTKVLFDSEQDLREIWRHVPEHPLQQDEPMGDRHWVENSPALMKVVQFEEMLGLEFKHVRLLARAFTMRNMDYNHLTMGHNQRLEFLGDTIINLIASDYLFKHFPDHHEGHLTLLRSSLVNNRTQAQVAVELGLPGYVINKDNIDSRSTYDLKQKDKADLLESFVGALFVDGGLEYCTALCEVCFFPRLMEFILNQDWNDPKSQLQQCCLFLRNIGDDVPDIPTYKVIHQGGPTNTRRFRVAVYFRGKRLAVGEAHNIQQAEMRAAAQALQSNQDKFQIPMSHRMRVMMEKNQALWEKEHGPLGPKSLWSSYSTDTAGKK